MTFDLRTLTLRQGRDAGLTAILVTLDGRIQDRVVAFDTDAGTVEALAGDQGRVFPFDLLTDADRPSFGNYRGLATFTRRGKTVRVYREILESGELTRILPAAD